MPTNTDTQFTARFSPMTIAGMVANQTALSSFVPTASIINTGMLSDIGRANIYAPDLQCEVGGIGALTLRGRLLSLPPLELFTHGFALLCHILPGV